MRKRNRGRSPKSTERPPSAVQTRHRPSPLSSLKEYRRKRNFAKTAEPSGKSSNNGESLGFVIQKHDASRLHYDFRLELDGTLKSWAVPKGVPFKKGEKRLAMQVEDHPVEYKDFEGTIPKGEYGGGTVMIWDQGTYEAVGDHPQKDLEQGKLRITLHGTKLDGEWTLVRMKSAADNEWLLIKSDEDMRPISKKRDNECVVSGRTMARIASDRTAEWRSNRQ